MSELEDNNESYLFVNENHASSFLTELHKLYVSQEFTDVVLQSDNKEDDKTNIKSLNNNQNNSDNYEKKSAIACHKVVLSAFSPYFKAMFSSNLLETRTNKVLMKNTNFQTLSEVVNYAYTSSICLNISNVQSIFVLASILQVSDLINACCEYMESKLDVNNSIDVYKLSKRYMCDYLSDKAREYINRNFTEIAKAVEFFELDDVDLLIELFESDALDVPSEEYLLNLTIDWINYEFAQRKIHFDSILTTCIRLSLVDEKFLKDFVHLHRDLLESNAKSLALIENHIKNHDLLEKYKQEKPRAGMSKAQQCFLLLGGNCDQSEGFYVNCFNPFNGEKYFISRSYCDLNMRKLAKGFFHVENPGVCVTGDNRIFLAGGNYVFHENKFAKQKYKTQTSSLREDHNLTDGQEVLSKEMYEYDNLRNAWTKKANMLFAKANFSLCSMQEKVYSFGGLTSGQNLLDIVEYYDINENKWTYVCTMPAPFVAGCVVEHQNLFYTLGGRSGGLGRSNSCFMFKPETSEWTEISSMNIGRFNFGACVLNDKIYVFGGQRYLESEQNYFTREALDSVELFDLNSREWSTARNMPQSLYNTGVCVYDDDTKCIYVCGTSECKYSGNTLFGFVFTSLFRLELQSDLNNQIKMKWTVVEHDLSEIKSNYRCIAAKLNTNKLSLFQTQIENLKLN